MTTTTKKRPEDQLERKRAYMRARYRAKREELIAKQIAYVAKNKEIVAARKRRWHEANSQRHSETTKRRYHGDPEFRRRVRAKTDAWIAANPEKRRTHVKVKLAIKAGKLKRGPCEKCGSSRRVHGHHDDYDKPLNVRWLCPSCHALHHRDQRKKQHK